MEDPLGSLRHGRPWIEGLRERAREIPAWVLTGLAAAVASAVVTAAVTLRVLAPTPVAPETYLPDIEDLDLSAAPATTTSAAAIIVHVAGAVAEPGLVEAAPDQRVGDLIALAGGVLPRADLGAVNLAAPVGDGARVYVPSKGETPPALVEGGVTGSEDTDPAPIDVNRADATELESLPGIGPVIAAAIIDHRERMGPFASVAELESVPGIGPKTVEPLLDLATTGP